jgi:2-polyprenyl-6-methoxyphenol hydroxylase-like FAD-dependent oxidoreductase
VSEPLRTPVVIVGGGPAGCAAALRLGEAGVPSLILERTGGEGNPLGESLAPTIGPLLDRLGVADAPERSGALPGRANRSCWGSTRVDERPHLASPYGTGWQLDRPAFNATLLDAAARAGATVLRNAPLRFIAPLPGGGWRLGVSGGEGPRTIEAGFAIDAGGRAAPLARRLGVRRIRHDALTAAWTVQPVERMLGPATLVESVEHGWWYAAPVPGGRVVVALFSDPCLIATHRAWQPQGWMRLLADTTLLSGELREAGMRLPERVRMAAAGPSRLERAAGEGWLAAGDAAATHDPLGSHGIGSALATAIQGADAVLALLAGNAAALEDYAARFAPRHDAEGRQVRAVYALERRWPDAPFWRRRIA